MENKDFIAGNVDVFALAKYALKRKLIMSLFILPFITTGIGYFSDRTFSGEVVFTITADSGSAQKMPSGLGGISSMVGLDLGMGQSEKYSRLKTLESRMFLLSFIRKNNLERVIFKNKWDEGKKTWDEPSVIAVVKYELEKYLRSDVIKPVASPPDNEKIVARFLEDHFFITENTKTEILTLKIIWDSPEEATRIANELVNDFNEFSRQKDINLFENQLRLYQEKYSTTVVDELRLQLVTMMASEMQKINIAEAKKDYALQVLDPAIPHYDKVSPSLIGIFIVSMMLVVFMALMTSFSLMKREVNNREIS